MNHRMPAGARRAIVHCAALLALCGPPSGAIADTTGAGRPLPLDEALQLAVDRSGRLGALQAQQDAARESAVAAGQRPDPVLKLGISNLPVDGPAAWSVGRDFMTMRNLGVMQELTRADKLAARSARALAEGDVSAAARRLGAAAVQREAALAWIDRSLQQTLRGLLVSQRAEAELQVQAAEALYRGGRGSQSDIFGARAEVELLNDRIDQAQREIDLATARLTRWIGDAAARPIAERPDFALPAWAAAEDAHLERHLADQPALQLAARQQALADAGVALAQAGQRNDWSVELMFSQRGSSFSNMLSLNFALPLNWDRANRQDRELAAAQSQVRAAAAERDDLVRAHAAEVRAMLVEWRSDLERIDRYDRRLLPLALQRQQAALAAYRAGSAPLAESLAARRALLALQVDRLAIETALARRWAAFTTLAGQLEAPPPDAAPAANPGAKPSASPAAAPNRSTR